MFFNALLLEQHATQGSVVAIDQAMLLKQAGDTLVRVDYSTLNYKDALALTYRSPIVRAWPMIPGIDCVGTVVSCGSDRFSPGQKVILNGWGAGESHWGGLAGYVYVDANWLIPLPKGITEQQAMAIGTAGYTAALCVLRLIAAGIKPDSGKVLVSGATGGVGSIAILLLAQLGYHVVGATRKSEQAGYVMALGAESVIDTQAISFASKALMRPQWCAAIDVAGSATLVSICAQIEYGGIVTACGLAQGMDFPASVAPFILRGITLAGIDSVMAPYAHRISAWNLIETHLNWDKLSPIITIIPLSACVAAAETILAGKNSGRYVVDVW